MREKFQPLFADDVENHWETDWKTGKGYAISYPATDGIHEYIDADDNLKDACKPSIHMPRWASRILLEITAVRVEQLQDISFEDAIAEGIYHYAAELARDPKVSKADIDAIIERHGAGRPQCLYAHLWEQINGAGSWAANPWVWIVEFRRIVT